MKQKLLLLPFLLLFGTPAVFSQIASIHFAEAFPELCIWVSGLPLVMAEGAEQVRVSEWDESPEEGVYGTGHTEFIYQGNFLIQKTGYTEAGEREYTMTYIYDDGYLVRMEYDFPLYDSVTIYYYDHYEDRIEVYTADAESKAPAREWLKTLWYNENNYLTEIEGPDWNRLFYYDDGFLVRADEERRGETYTTIYTYTEDALLQSILIQDMFELTLSYNEVPAVAGIHLEPFYRTAVSGNLQISRNSRGDLGRIGPTEIEWTYRNR